jgi:hypothetical protein
VAVIRRGHGIWAPESDTYPHFSREVEMELGAIVGPPPNNEAAADVDLRFVPVAAAEPSSTGDKAQLMNRKERSDVRREQGGRAASHGGGLER